MELMIIECKNCGNAYKGDITKPFLCPKCIQEGVKLPEMEVATKKEVKDILPNSGSTDNKDVIARLNSLEQRVTDIENLIKRMTE